MANEFREKTSHSAEYFGDTRDHWWNRDFLELMARRLAFDRVCDMLDVGCGVGHWGQLLAGVLPASMRLQGVDRDPVWVEKARERATERELSDRFHYRQATAERLPFDAASFDLVTCQTLLIHVADPGIALDEMIRVLRPGGLLLVVEPNNIAGALVCNSVSFRWPAEKLIGLAHFQLMCERGKAALGEGNNSIGDVVPGLFAARGLTDIQVYLNDKACAAWPPYDTPEQRAMFEEGDDLGSRDFWIWSRSDTHRFFLAGGGAAQAFDVLWTLAMSDAKSGEFDEARRNLTYASAGGGVSYLVAGRKPLS